MGFTTASGLIEAVRAECDNTGASDTVMYALLNNCLMQVQREHDFTFQEQVASRTFPTSASGFSRFAQPTDAKELISLYTVENTARNELFYTNYYDAITEFPDPSETSTAGVEAWSLFRNEIYVFPGLSSAVSAELYYYRFLPEFTATGSNDFLIWAPDILKYGTKREYYQWLGESNKAVVEQQLLSGAVAALLKYHKATKERPRHTVQMRTPGTQVGTSRGGRLRMFLDSRHARW
jgi:hypothetical protein